MGYTDPFTWTSGLIPTDAQLNAALRDNIRAGGGPRSTTPPTATDEQEWIYPADPTNGVNWALKYNAGSGSAFKWECVGGSPVTVLVDNDETCSNAYADLATVGPSFTLPRAGDYLATVSAQAYSASAGIQLFAAVKRGTAATVDADSVPMSGYGGDSSHIGGGFRQIRLDGMAAGDVVKMQYKGNSAGTHHFLRREMRVIPVRVS